MIDIHCHILPGLDDGSKHMEESIQMARIAYKQGITKLIATPHHRTHRFDNEKQVVLEAVNNLNQRLADEEIPVMIYPGQEIRLHNEMVYTFNQDELLSLNNSHYILIELPTDTLPSYTEHLLYNLQSQGYVPVIAHPERYDYFVTDLNVLYDLIKHGALTQLTAGSLTGAFGKKTKKIAETMVKHRLVHLLASDAHHLKTRTFDLAEGYLALEKLTNETTVTQFKQQAEAVLVDRQVTPLPPVKVKTKRFFGLF